MLSNPDEAGMWTGRTDGERDWLTHAEFEKLRDHANNFSALMASQTSLSTWQVRFDGGEWEEACGRLVSGGFFDVLGVSPAIGRVFTTAEDRDETPYAVLSYNYWQRRFGGRPDVLGKTFTLHSAVLTIIGVASRGFIGETSGQQPDLWLPLRMQPSVFPGRDWLHDTPPSKTMWLHVFGRLKPRGQSGAGGSAGQRDLQGRVGIVLRTYLRHGNAGASFWISGSRSGRARVERPRRAMNSPIR